MLRVIIGLLLFTACSNHTVRKGGDKVYAYDPAHKYDKEDLSEMAPDMIFTSHRDPPAGTLDKLFPKGGTAPLKRIGIIIFESVIQPTRGGLAGEDRVYVSEQGKQLITEKLYTIWNEVLLTMQLDLDYVPRSEVRASKSLHKFGSPVVDHIKAKRSSLAPDDIFYLEKGKKTPTTTLLNHRGMQDLSFMFVPANELMGGPKWSEHNKHFVNEVIKELNLDAAIIVMSELSWSASRTDKHSGENIPEALKIKIDSSTLLSLSEYRRRAELVGVEAPNVTLCYRSYQAKLTLPVTLSTTEELKKFETIEKELINPLFKTYTDLSIMMIDRMAHDLRKTF